MVEREEMDWDLYGKAVRELAQTIADDDFQPDIILAIVRGGMLVAGSLGYALAVKNLYVMNVEYYTGVDEHLDLPVVLPPHYMRRLRYPDLLLPPSHDITPHCRRRR